MLVVAAGNTLLYSPRFSGRWGLAFSAALTAAAGVELLRRGDGLRRREVGMGWVVVVVFCVGQVVVFARASVPPSVKRGVDFSAYYLAGKVLDEAPGESIYDLPLFADGRLNLNVEDPPGTQWYADAARSGVPFAAPYIYPPYFAVMMKPLARLPFASAYLVWTVMSVIAVIGAVLLSLSVAGVRIGGTILLMLGVGVFSYYPLWDNLFFGQISGVILFLFAAGVWLLVRQRSLGSALCFAVATMIKLTPVLVVPVLVIHRRWRWLTAYVVWMVALFGFSLWQAGWGLYSEFLHKALPSMNCGAPVCQNTSVVALVQEMFLGRVPLSAHPSETIPAGACAVSRWVALGIYLLMLGRCFAKRRDGLVVRDIVMIAMLGIAVSPISWWHHSVLDLLPFIYLWGTAKSDRTLTAGNWMLTALVLVVSTNVVGFVALGLGNHAVQLIFAAIVPGLTIAVAWMMLGRGPDEAPEDSKANGPAAFSTNAGNLLTKTIETDMT
jgi:alpha-1,2-mannosyltransferase